MAAIIQPIWKDFYFEVNGDYVDYTVSYRPSYSQQMQVIYRGRAYARPGGGNLIQWSINDIAANYLRNVFPYQLTHGSAVYNMGSEGMHLFAVTYGGVTDEIVFFNDWSHIEVPDGQYRQVVQIVDVVDRRIPLIITSDDDAAARQTNDVYWVRNAVETIGGFTWKTVDTCYRYALYFLNAFGGWSLMNLEAVKALQDYDREVAKRIVTGDRDIESLPRRNSVAYVNQVTQRWTAKTPYLTDDQAAKMWHLLGTNNAFLFDMEATPMLPVPVLVTNGTAEEKTYRNQGAKRVRYDISLTLAQDRLRR